MDVTVAQIGFSNGGGAVANMYDGDLNSFWRPVADGLDAYPMIPVADSGLVIPGYQRPAIQFDFGEKVRIPYFRVKVETPATIGQCFLIAGDASATSLDDTVQAGDVWAGGYYTVAQMNSGEPLETKAKLTPMRYRFWRFVFWKQPPAA